MLKYWVFQHYFWTSTWHHGHKSFWHKGFWGKPSPFSWGGSIRIDMVKLLDTSLFIRSRNIRLFNWGINSEWKIYFPPLNESLSNVVGNSSDLDLLLSLRNICPLIYRAILFQRAECNLNFDLYKIVFCFQINKDIPISEHTRMKPKIFSMQGWFN